MTRISAAMTFTTRTCRRGVFRTTALVAALGCLAAATGRAQWTGQDIGAVGAPGSSSGGGSSAAVTGSGADIWGGADAFHFAYTALAGDGVITARVTGMTDTDGWAKAGLMIREQLDPGARNVFVAATPEWHGVVAQQRAAASGETTSIQGPGSNTPVWLRLTRSGSAIAAAASADGVAWETFSTFSAALNSTVYIGLAVTSHHDGTLCTATFDNVTITSGGGTSGSSPSINLTATGVSSSQIALSWTTTAPTQDSYFIQRSTGGDFTQIATVAATTNSYTDFGLSPSITYFYRIQQGYGAASNIASATTSAAPPDGTWQSADIGTTTAGQTSASGDTVSLTGSGTDIWNQADGFRYYYESVGTGDAEIIVRVASLQDTSGWAKAGVMARQSLDPGSPEAWVCVSAEHGTAFQWRTTANGDTQSSTPTEDGTAPRWLKLVYKAANPDAPVPPMVIGYVSTDGTTWQPSGSVYLPTAAGYQYIGLAVTSHNDGTLCTAQFDNLKLLTPPPAPAGFQVTHRGPNAEIDLAWSYNATDVNHFEIKTNPQTAGDHDWTLAASVPGDARQAVIRGGNSDGVQVEISAFRDFVRSPAATLWATPTITPSLSVDGTTSSSVTLHIVESFGYGGGQNGPWSLERSSDGTTFAVIASGLTPTGGTAYSDYTDYTDTGLPSGVTRYYRARQLLTNGDSSAYSGVVSATTTATATGTPPAAPTGLTATAMSSTQIQLNWTDNATDETGFQIQRSTDGTNFNPLATVAANTNQYADTAVSASSTYYYRVAAVNGSGISAYTTTASATTPATSPTGSSWLSQDIGNPAAHGSTSTNSTGDSVTVSGSGADIWNGADSFQFAYQRLNGDATIVARVVSMTDTDGWAKAGVMIRESLDANARNVFVALTPEFHGLVAQARTTPGDVTSQTAGPAVNAPYWVLLMRAGNTFRAYASDGVNGWTSVASFTVAMNSTVYIGLAVTSHHDGALCTASFDNVTVRHAVKITGISPGTPVSGGATTTSSSFTFTGTADPGTTVVLVLESGTAGPLPGTMGRALVDANGAWSLAVDGFPAGTYQFGAGDDSNKMIVAGSGPFIVTVQQSSATATTPGWLTADIGSVGVAGSQNISGNSLTVSGSGADVWGTADAFRFVSKPWTGDGVVEAQVASMGNTNGWAKAGVMIRESTAAGARNVFVALTPSWHGIVAQARSNSDDVTTQAAGPANDAPYWVRLARTGNTFTASSSPDGITWTPFASFSVAMSATADFGFAVTSHDNTQLNQAVFQDPYVGSP